MNFLKFFFTIWAIFFSSVTFSQEIPSFQGNFLNLTKEKIDGGPIVAAIEDLRLNNKVDFAVLVVDSTKPMEIEQYSIKVAEKWKIGREKTDNGAILIVAIKDKATRFEVGYGLEGQLTDALTSRIVKDYMIPRFKNSDWQGGILEAMGRSKNILSSKKLEDPYTLNSGGVASVPKSSSNSATNILSSASNVDGDAAILILLIAGVVLLFTTKIGKIILLGIVIGSVFAAIGNKIHATVRGVLAGGIAGGAAYYFSAGPWGTLAAALFGAVFGIIGIMKVLEFLMIIVSSIGSSSGSSGGRGGSSGGGSSSSGGGGFGGGGSSGKW